MSFEIWKPRIQGLSSKEETRRWMLISQLDPLSITADQKTRLSSADTRCSFAEALAQIIKSKGIQISVSETDQLLGLLECKETMDNLDYPNPSIDQFSMAEKAYIIVGFLSSKAALEFKSIIKFIFRKLAGKTKLKSPSKVIENLNLSKKEIEQARSKLSEPSSELWRLHIDWEHQRHGPTTYEHGYHSRKKKHREPGYLNGCINAHKEVINKVGEVVDLAAFTEINRLLLTPHRPHRNVYETMPADITRIKHTTDVPFIKDLDKKFVRNRPFSSWEAFVFGKYMEKKDEMMEFYPYLTNYLINKYGENFKLTKKILNAEMYRYQVSYLQFRWFNKVESHENVITTFLANFYFDMEKLKEEENSLYKKESSNKEEALFDIVHRKIFRIAQFQKWIEYFHGYSDGTSRQGCMIVNKVAVEYGLSPSVSSFRHDSRFYTDEIWAANVAEGMCRWEMIAFFSETGLLDHVLKLVDHEVIQYENQTSSN